MRSLRILVLSLLLPLSAAATPLELRPLLERAAANHPKIEMARQKVAAAEAHQMSARGAFDLELAASLQSAPVGTYERNLAEIGVSQPTTLWGAKLSAKYRNGDGFAVYDGKSTTSSGGELALGLLIPLWRDGPIDKARFGRAAADLERSIAEQQARQKTADLLADTANAYFEWNLAGQKRAIYRDLLRLAEDRSRWLDHQVASGQIAEIERADNLRLVAERRAKLTRAELSLRRAALKLGLYHQNEQGQPLAPTDQQLLARLPDSQLTGELWQSTQLERIDAAPTLHILSTGRTLLEKEARLARNQAAPRVDLQLLGTQSFGAERAYSSTSTSVTETTVLGRLGLEFDVQRRAARGKAQELDAKARELDAALTFERSRLEAEIEVALASLRAGHETAELSRQATEQAEIMAAAERERFSLGQSSVLSVNLREAAVLDARVNEAESLYAYHQARIELGRLLGTSEISDLPVLGEGSR